MNPEATAATADPALEQLKQENGRLQRELSDCTHELTVLRELLAGRGKTSLAVRWRKITLGFDGMDLMVVLALAALTRGASLIYRPAGYLVFGALLLVGWISAARRQAPEPPNAVDG